jgi:hypothetical protein
MDRLVGVAGRYDHGGGAPHMTELWSSGKLKHAPRSVSWASI